MSKTQTLNTVFTGNASPMMGEVQRFSGAVNTAMLNIFSRVQAIQSLSRTTGMGTAGAQQAGRLGTEEAVAQLAKFKMMGADMGKMGARRLGLDAKEFAGANEAEQFEMLAEGLSKIKNKRRRWLRAASMGIGTEALLDRAGQYEMDPGLAERRAARAGQNNMTPNTLATVERLGIAASSMWGKSMATARQALVAPLVGGEYLGAVREGRATPEMRKEFRSATSAMGWTAGMGGLGLLYAGGGAVLKLLGGIYEQVAGIKDNTK